MTWEQNSEVLQKPCRKLRPREVLDMHADLQRQLARPEGWYDAGLRDYARRDIGANPEWSASHLHPAVSLDDLDPWIASLGNDLISASTYQVTSEMVDLARALQPNTPGLANICEEDLPAHRGFMWFDQPVPRPSADDQPGQEPLMMQAVSWAWISAMPVQVVNSRDRASMTGVVPVIRVREWGYNDSLDVRPRPLHLMGQTTLPLTKAIRTPMPEMWFVHMVWILMGMEITSSRTERADRHGAKRARNLEHAEVQVITLRRPARGASEKPSSAPKHIDWSCTWLVRGHYRQAPHGGTYADGRDRTWIRPYIKGPDGAPLRAKDILWRLSQ